MRNANRDNSDPETATLELETGTAAGGIVRDEDGHPIAGARVIPWLFEGDATSKRTFFSPEGGVATTDAQGHWRASIMPADAKGSLMIRLVHPDYVSDPVGFSLHLSIDQARDMTGVMVMRRGFTVVGKVIGPDGRSIAGAAIVVPLSRSQGHWFRTTTDAEGRFRIAHVDGDGRSDVQVRAEATGFAPASVRVEVRPDAPSVTLRLTKGHPFRGRVVDAKGGAIAAARISVDAWAECEKLEWRSETDSEGRFTWPDAPKTGDIYFAARKDGYAEAHQRKLSAIDPDPVIIMNRPLVVRGSVVDADTGQIIDRFNVVEGGSWRRRLIATSTG